jgi:hypothetical protein
MGIKFHLPKEEMEKLKWFDQNIARTAKILNGRRMEDPVMAEEKLPPLSFGSWLLGASVLAIVAEMSVRLIIHLVSLFFG